MNNTDNTSLCKFGSYNPETKESLEGYMKDGEMKFRKYPWYKRLWFRIKHNLICDKKLLVQETIVEEYIGIKKISIYNWLFRTERIRHIPIYRKYIKETNKTLRLRSQCIGRHLYFDTEAYDKDNLLVLID